MTTENAQNDPENRDPTCNDHKDLQSADQGASERELRQFRTGGPGMGFADTQPVTMVRLARPEVTTSPTRAELAERIRTELAYGRLALEHLGESGSRRCTPWAAQHAALWCQHHERRGVWLDVAQQWMLAELQQRVGEQPRWRAVYDEAEQLVRRAMLAAEGHLRAVEGGHG